MCKHMLYTDLRYVSTLDVVFMFVGARVLTVWYLFNETRMFTIIPKLCVVDFMLDTLFCLLFGRDVHFEWVVLDDFCYYRTLVNGFS